MDLNDRKRKILQAVIDEYITSAEPVGSRAISKIKDLGVSSATIRNEMADLEDMGFLVQPHTSAGRVPSDDGYRFYVESLMSRYRIGMDAIENLHLEFEQKVNQLDGLIKKASMMIAELTDYTTFMTTPDQTKAIINKIDIIDLNNGRAIVIVVTNEGVVRDRTIYMKIGMENAQKLAYILTTKLQGLSSDEIDFPLINEIQDIISSKMVIKSEVLVAILNFVYETVSDLSKQEVYVRNTQSMLKYPEYKDVSKAREIVGFLENNENLKKVVTGKDKNTEITVTIGNDNKFEQLKDCSLVMVDYSLNNKSVGKIGVIGPKRMDYAKVFASLDLISKHLDSILGGYDDN